MLSGPSHTLDAACSASFVCMDQALLAIRTGQCDSAIVAGCNMCYMPALFVQFDKLNMLSPDGACKSFDESGEGNFKDLKFQAVNYNENKLITAGEIRILIVACGRVVLPYLLFCLIYVSIYVLIIYMKKSILY